MRRVSLALALAPALLLAPPAAPQAAAATPAPAAAQAQPRPQPSPQPRPHGRRLEVDLRQVTVDDGDTVLLRWGQGDVETVRILGIDTPETRHPEHGLPMAQPFGPEARAFAQGAFATATRVELLRSATLDPYGRTLGYLFLNGQNYSLLVLRARLAEESVTRYGDNGLPQEAAEVLRAAAEQGPLPFESPDTFRRRWREVGKAWQQRGEQAPY